MRLKPLLIAVLLGGATVAGGAFAFHLWHRHAAAHQLLARLPAPPDLSRWPAGFANDVARLTATASEAKDPVPALGQLATLYLANNYDAPAEQLLQLLRTLDPQNPRWPYFLGTLRLRAGDQPGAERLFGETVRLAPESAAALLQWGEALGRRGAGDEAKAAFERRLKLLPDDAPSRFGLAKLAFAQGDVRGAIAQLRPLTVRHPQFQEAHLMLADLLEKTGDTAGAAAQRTVLRGGHPSPPVPDPWLDEAYLHSYDAYRMQAFGVLRVNAGQLAAGLPFLERSLALDPNDVDVQAVLAKALSDLGRAADAEAVLEAGLKASPGNDALLASLADVLAKAGQPDRAIKELRRALDSAPAKPLSQSALGRVLLLQGKAEEAIVALQTALRLNPLLVDAELDLARAERTRDHRDEAQAALARALKMRPDDALALGMAASMAFEQGNLETAERHAGRLLQVAPEDAEGRALFARIELQRGNQLSEAGRTAEAVAAYRRGLAANQAFGPLHGALGMLYGKQRNLLAAAPEFETYLTLAPSDPFGYVLLGSTYAGLGKFDAARETLSKGLTVAEQAKDRARTEQLQRLLQSLPHPTRD